MTDVTTAEAAFLAAAEQATYLAEMDRVIETNFPNAAGAGVLAFSDLLWGLVGSVAALADDEKRYPTDSEKATLARWADMRHGDAAPVSFRLVERVKAGAR
jgi:hypothetical protein